MHICTVTVAIVQKCTILHLLMWVFFCSNCVKLVTFSILHNYTSIDVIALKTKMTAISTDLASHNIYFLLLVRFRTFSYHHPTVFS